MTLLPWEADRELTLVVARSAVREAFPTVDVSRFDRVGAGWESDVFLTADDWAFRFPRRAEYQSLFDRERPVLALARRILPSDIAVPRVELLGAPSAAFPYRFAGHRFIAGVAADMVPGEMRDDMARSIGIALSTIHSVPATAARDAGVSEVDGLDDGTVDWFRRNLAAVLQLPDSSRSVRDAVSWVSGLADPLRPLEAPVRFIHNDLSPEHLVVDPATGRLAGILDWTDAALGDPARDLVTCVAFGGWGFAERVLASYSGAVDRGFRERLHYMTRLLSVMWLGEAAQNGGDVAKHVRWVANAFAP